MAAWEGFSAAALPQVHPSPLAQHAAPGSFQLSLASAAPGCEGAAHLIPAILECEINPPVFGTLLLPLTYLTGGRM